MLARGVWPHFYVGSAGGTFFISVVPSITGEVAFPSLKDSLEYACQIFTNELYGMKCLSFTENYHEMDS